MSQLGDMDSSVDTASPAQDEATWREDEPQGDDEAVLVLHLSPLGSPSSSAPGSPRKEDDSSIPAAVTLPLADPKQQQTNPRFLSSTTPDRVIDWLAFENENPAELQAFFVTMNKITTPLEMFTLFVEAFEKRQQNASTNNDHLQARTEHFLRKLTECATRGYPIVTSELMTVLSTFACAHCDQAFVVEIRNLLKPLLHESQCPEEASVASRVMQEPSVALSLHRMVQFEGEYLPAYVEYGVLPFCSSHLAETLSMIEQDLFLRIGHQEYLDVDQPHVTAMEKHCQMITDWVASEILAADSGLQLTVAKKFINLAWKLLNMNNLNGAMEVWGGIIFTERIWYPRLPSRYQEAFQHLKTVFNPEGNMKNYKAYLSDVLAKGQAFLPSLNVHTRELFFVAEGNPEAKEEGQINYERLSLQGGIITLLLRARQRQYTFAWREDEVRFLANAWFLPTKDKENCSDAQNSRAMARRWKEAKDSIEPEVFPDDQALQQCLEAIYNLCDDAESSPGWKEGFENKVHESTYLIARILYSPECGVDSRPRVWKGEIYPSCFSGWDLVDGMRRIGLVSNPAAALEVGQQLLRNGYIKVVGHLQRRVFKKRFGALYEFVVDDTAWPEQEQQVLLSIDDGQQRLDRELLATLIHSSAGPGTSVYWHAMESFYCLSAKALVSHLTANTKLSHSEALAFCERLLSYKYLVFVPDAKRVETFQESDDRFYKFDVGPTHQISRQVESPFDPEARKERLRRRDLLSNRTAQLKVSAESRLKEIHLPRRSESSEERSPLRLRIPRPSLRHGHRSSKTMSSPVTTDSDKQ